MSAYENWQTAEPHWPLLEIYKVRTSVNKNILRPNLETWQNHAVIQEDCIFLTRFLCQALCTQRTPKGPKLIVGSMNMGYISDTARNRTHNLFRPKQEPIPLGHSDRQSWPYVNVNALSGRMSIEAEIFPGQMTICLIRQNFLVNKSIYLSITRHPHHNYIFVLNMKFHSGAVPRMDLSPSHFVGHCQWPPSISVHTS